MNRALPLIVCAAGVIRQVGRSLSGLNVTVDAYTVFNLITDAYDLKDYQVSGAAEWVKTDRCDIAARAEGDAAPPIDQIRGMLQSLLAERFGFKLHRETREMSDYAAEIAKGGSKLEETSSAVQMMVLGNQGPTPGVERPVLDKTRLAGRFDFPLTLAPFSI